MTFFAAFLAIATICHNGAIAQMWGSQWGSGFNQAQTRPLQQAQPSAAVRYLTCIGQTANNDQLRVTFSSSGTRFSPEIRVTANIQAGANSQIAGNFRLVITNEGRIDGMCDPNALGTIMSLRSTQQNRMGMGLFNRQMQQQQNNQGQIATIGSVFGLRSGQSVSMTDILENMSFSRLTGSGMAICNQIVGNRCVGTSLPLCCTIARDAKTAAPSLSRGLVGGMGGSSFVGGVGGNFGGMSPGLSSPIGATGGMNNNIQTPGAQGGLVFP
ncbi:hypothetical protein SNE40_016343 [Patella caerulea]|uniref:Uncharacterized protein n=1 Tax=Patella caerulea TaxID=87958 RepID=A0AAN8JB79_PATCE